MNTNNVYVGLCGTKHVGSDMYAMVITEILSPKCIRVADMTDTDYNFNRVKDKKGNEYIRDISPYIKYSKDNNTQIIYGQKYRLRKNGRWLMEGAKLHSTGAVYFGTAENYLDPSY